MNILVRKYLEKNTKKKYIILQIKIFFLLYLVTIIILVREIFIYFNYIM